MANKISALQGNQIIAEAIKMIANRGIVNPKTGIVKNTGKVTGYVAKIHTDGELAGTIDVQEYIGIAHDNNDELKIGYHEGVYLSAIQDNSNGMVIIPKLYSDVVVTVDPETMNEYVTMFSHVDCIQLDSHETITVGVREREDFDENDEESPDVHELELTGAQSQTTYNKESITSSVQDKDGGSNVTSRLQNTDEILDVVGKDKTSFHMTQEEVELKRDSAKINMTKDEIVSNVSGNKVKIDKKVVYLGGDSGTEHAVLGETLCDTLISLLDAIIQIKTTTQLGPQPPLNIAQFIQMKAQITQYKGAISGFLTKVVEIKK